MSDASPDKAVESPIEKATDALLGLSSGTVSNLKRIALILALAAVALSFVGQRLAWLDYKPGGAAFDVYIRPAFTGIFAIAILLSLRWPIAGGILAGFAGAGLIAFATNQLVATHAALVIAALTVPAAMWLVVDLNELSLRRASFAIGGAALAAIAGFAVGNFVYHAIWGPTHPESTVVALDDSAVEWVWAGRVTPTSAEVRAHPDAEFSQVRLAVSASEDLSDPWWVDPRDASGRVVGFDITDLDPASTYHYAVEVDGELDTVRSGRLTTFPDGAQSFRVAIGSCARVGSNGAVFDAIRDKDPLFYLIAGDLHYGDNDRNDIVRYQEVMDLTLSEPAQAALYRSTPIVYMWDDHDYGGNDADGSSRSREAAMAAYREHVPSYDLAGDRSAVYQAFTVGRVRFILTDARSARNLDNDDNTDAPSMLGFEQKAWFKNEIVEAANTHELVVWLNPVPWIADAEDGADHWGGFAVERRELANHIADNDIDNLVMVSGDAHMLAIDDGTNTNFSDRPGKAFPLIHSAPLDRPAGVKGGPYSEGVIAESGQFSTLDIDDDGNRVRVTMRGFDWTGEQLMEFEFDTST